METTQIDLSLIDKAVIESAIKVFRTLGSGLKTSAYQACLIYELNQYGYSVQCDIAMPVEYENKKINKGYIVEMIVANNILIQNISDNTISPRHELEMQSFLKLNGLKSGYILNWKNLLKRNGIKHISIKSEEKA